MHTNEIKIGDGATIYGWTDRYPATVIKATACTVTLQRDKAIRVDDHGMSELQDYRFEPDPAGEVETFRRTARGWFHKGTRATIGERRAYHDFSF
jgi:hypothetical protein